MKKVCVWSLLATFLLAGCAPATGPKQQTGALLGAGTGALLGAQFGHGHGRLAAVAIGTLAGAMFGQEIGRSLDQADKLAMQQSTQNGLERYRTQESSDWVNPDTGHSGTLTPIKTYRTAQNEYCREYLQTVVIGGEESRAYGTACREVDGNWKVVN